MPCRTAHPFLVGFISTGRVKRICRAAMGHCAIRRTPAAIWAVWGRLKLARRAHAPPPRDLSWKVHMEITMIRLIAFGFALAVATSAQAMSPAPLHQPDGMITQVRSNCGAGMRWNEALGRCATTSARRHVRRGVVTGSY